MRDIHCHILPGIDDGARDLVMSLEMLRAARESGVTSIVCTPHVRDMFFDYKAAWKAFDLLSANVNGFPLQMGFEVNHRKLMELGINEWAEKLKFSGSEEFLLEFSSNADRHDYHEYEKTIYKLQNKGLKVIIAHPERYRAVQEDIKVASKLVRMGCKLQVSADFISGGRMGSSKEPARRLFKEGLVSHLSSDAHNPKHYKYLSKAREKYNTRGRHAQLRDFVFSC